MSKEPDFVAEYDETLHAIGQMRKDWTRLVDRARILSVSVPEEDRKRIEILHGVAWRGGFPRFSDG